MSVTNESRIRSWFQFTSKSSSSAANTTANGSNGSNTSTSNTSNNNNANNGLNAGNGFSGRADDDNNAKEQMECQTSQSQTSAQTTGQSSNGAHNTSNTLLERVTSFRRSLGKAQNKKNKIRPTSVKGLTSGAVEQQNIAKSNKNNSVQRKGSSPTSVVATSGGGSATSANCDDDEIYGFTSANFDASHSSTRRQLKSSFHSIGPSNQSNVSNAPNAGIACIAPNANAYESDANKSGRVRNEERDESHAMTASTANTTATTGLTKGVAQQDSPEWMKADKEFSFYSQQHQKNFDAFQSQQRLHFYKQQYFHDSDINLRHSSAQRMSWIEPINSENDDIDRIYENMRGLSTALASAQQRHNRRNSSNNNNLYVNSVNSNDVNNTVNSNNRKLTKDSGYESASASIANWAALNANNGNALSNNYFHSRSDSNTSSVSTGGSLSPRTAANSGAKSAYHYCDQWSAAAKSTSNLPLQVQVSGTTRRSSLTGSGIQYPENIVNNSGKSVLPAKSVPGNLDRDSDENIVKKRSHNRNNPTPSSVYSLLASKSGFDFAPVLKSSRKSCGASFADNAIVAKFNQQILSKKVDPNGAHLWKTREKNICASYGQEDRYEMDDSPPPTPPVRDSSLASNRKFSSELQESESQNKLSLSKGANSSGVHYAKNNNAKYYMKSYSENRISHNIGYSKSLINLRSKCDESSDLKQFSQTYPLLPETEFSDKSSHLNDSWSCDQSVTSGVTSLVTTSDYFTASSSVITHSPSLSSLSTNATNTTTASYNNSRNSISSTGSSSQIAKSSKVVQPKRESASVLFHDKSGSPNTSNKPEVPPPPAPPPKLSSGDFNVKDSGVRSSVNFAPKMMSTSRTVETAKTHRASDPEIKAIQKRAVYQFYLKQKQKETQENSSNNSNAITNSTLSTSGPEDNNKVPSRKVHLIVRENIYENTGTSAAAAQQTASSSPPPLPSPPLPPPPPHTIADIEFIGDLPLPPPPSAQECHQPESALSSPKVDIHEPTYGQLLGRSPSPPKDTSVASALRCVDVVPPNKSEIATQTTETLRRNSACASAKETTQQIEPSHESSEPMYHNSVPTSQTTICEENGDNKSMESAECVEPAMVLMAPLAPWAYSKLWPKDEKCAKTMRTTYYESYASAQTSSPIAAANTFIEDNVSTGSELTNEDLLANKSELISRISRKLDVLRSEEMALTQDIDSNELLGQHIKTKLKAQGLTAQESEKINLHCDETEKVTRLLLSISARLQLIQSQINDKNSCNESKSNECKQNWTQNDLQIRDKQNACSSALFDEIQSLVSKRQKLLIQLEEALQLRVCIDHRNKLIEEKIIKKYFRENHQNMNEFLEFIKLKSKLIVDIREVKDRIQMGEKHLYALRTS